MELSDFLEAAGILTLVAVIATLGVELVRYFMQ